MNRDRSTPITIARMGNPGIPPCLGSGVGSGVGSGKGDGSGEGSGDGEGVGSGDGDGKMAQLERANDRISP